MKTDLTARATIPPMNTDKPTPAPQDITPAEPATVDESAEPTVALSGGDGEPTVALSAGETTAATVGLSSSAGSEPTADPADSVPEGDEPTVALSAAAIADATVEPEDEETVTLTAGEEETVTLTAGDEETVTLTAGALAAAADASEPTIALPKPRVSPEAEPAAKPEAKAAAKTTAKAAKPGARVALPASRPPKQDTEPTTALLIPDEPAPRPTPESTVTLPPIPAPRSIPTVTPPPAEPTIATPVAPVTPAVVPPPAKPLTRRRLLWAAAGTALIGGTIAALAGRGGDPDATKTPSLVVTEPAPTQTVVPTPTAPKPTTPVMTVPVHTLEDFRKVVPGDPFPTDAIALTIDDGPHPVWTPKILRLLEKHDVPALFCMIGNQVLGHEPTARDVAADGHQLANHTWSHPIDLAGLPPHKMIKEIHRAQDKIYSTTGFTPSLFRAPGGAWSKGLSASVSQSNVIPMDWSADPRDWAMPGVAQITNRLLAAKPGQILLCHDGGGDRSQTLTSLKTVIPALQARGLKFVALM
jgi:peptidoglycan/xylan/chitin deacetylase (PgdA/CDA1 family)